MMRVVAFDRLDPHESIASIGITINESIGSSLLTIIFRSAISVPRRLQGSSEHLLMPYFKRYFPEATQVIRQSDPRHYHHRPDEVTRAHIHIDLGLNRAPNSEEVCNIIRAIRDGSRQLEGEVHTLDRLVTQRTYLTETSAERLLQEIKYLFSVYGQEKFLYYSSLNGVQTAVSLNRPLPALNAPTFDEIARQERNNERNFLLGTVLLGVLVALLLDCCLRSKRCRKKKTNPEASTDHHDTSHDQSRDPGDSSTRLRSR